MRNKLLLLTLMMSKSLFSQGINLAKEYQENSTPQKKLALECIKDLSIQKGVSILDIGCGDGQVSQYLADLTETGTVTGLDVSKEMIDLASSTIKRSNLAFIQKNAENFSLDEKVDLITCFMSFHWIKDQKSAMNCFYKNLNPKGKVFISIPAKCKGRASVAAQEISQKDKWKPFFKGQKLSKVYLSEEEFVNLAQKAHFKVEKIETVEKSFRFESKEAYKAWVTPIINGIDHLSKLQKEHFIQDVMDNLLKIHHTNEDGSVLVSAKTLNVILVRL